MNSKARASRTSTRWVRRNARPPRAPHSTHIQLACLHASSSSNTEFGLAVNRCLCVSQHQHNSGTQRIVQGKPLTPRKTAFSFFPAGRLISAGPPTTTSDTARPCSRHQSRTDGNCKVNRQATAVVLVCVCAMSCSDRHTRGRSAPACDDECNSTCKLVDTTSTLLPTAALPGTSLRRVRAPVSPFAFTRRERTSNL